MSSLIPLHTFPGAIFVEARMMAQPSTVISQIGLSIDAPDCSVAVFSRASGVLLVAGVGSYCAYRICTKFLGQRFVWMLLESSRLDTLPSADRRLLYDVNLPFPGEEVIRDSDEDDGDRVSEDEWREKVEGSRPASQISRSSRFRHSVRAKGLLSIRQSPTKRDGVLSRRSTNASGSQRSVASLRSSCSDKSASLNIVWEGGQDWDDEFALAPSSSRVPRRHPMTSQSADSAHLPRGHAPSIGDMCSVFDDVMSVTSALDHCQEGILFETSYDGEDDVTLDESQLSRIKCMTDSKYMYHSVLAGSEMGSEVGSECGRSVRSTTSNLFRMRKKMTRTMDPDGLWSLAQDEPSTSSGNNLMIDSGLTRSTHSKKSSSSCHRSMFDSAIGTDVVSSEDESVGGQTRFPLDCLREVDSMSIAQSEVSMEWFDDDGLRITESDRRVPIDGFDWDMEDGVRAEKTTYSISPMHRPSSSRDLMVMACQTFQPYSPQFKLLHQLYHKRRLKRVGGGESMGNGESADRQVADFLSQVLYHRCRLVRESTWEQLEEKLARCLSECDFLHHWRERSAKVQKNQLRALWDLCEFPSCGASSEQVKGLEVLLVLQGIKVYEQKMKGSAAEDLSWYTHDSPAVLMHRIEENKPLDQVSWTLLAQICDVSLELIDANFPQNPPVRTEKASTVLSWLKLGATVMPLYYIPDDL